MTQMGQICADLNEMPGNDTKCDFCKHVPE